MMVISYFLLAMDCCCGIMTILFFLQARGLYDIRGRFLVMPWTILLCDETYEYASIYLDTIWYGNALG